MQLPGGGARDGRLVSVETVLLVLLVVLVAGLLRSHAEILRRLGTGRGRGAARSAAAADRRPRRPESGAAPIAGTTPDGDAVALDFEGRASAPTLLAFLTTGCSCCADFWQALGERRLPGVQTVIVTHGSERERPRAAAGAGARPGCPVVMSSGACTDYEVPGSPYFVLVGRVGSRRGLGHRRGRR